MPRPSKGARLYFRREFGTWYIRDGQFQRSTGCALDDREGAERALEAYLAQKHTPNFGRGDPDRVTILDVLYIYQNEYVPTRPRPDVALGAIPHLGAFWQQRMVGEITPKLCADYVAWRCQMRQARYKLNPETAPFVGSQTARRELEVLSAAIGYAYRERKLRYPVPVGLPDKAEPKERYLLPGEVAQLLWACLGWMWVASEWPSRRPVWRRIRTRENQVGVSRGDFYTPRNLHVARFILVGVYTGTRHDAILRLRWLRSIDGGYVDLRDGLIYRKGEREGQTTKRRTPVAISDRLAAHLRRWRRDSVSYVVEYQGQPIERMNRAWNTVVRNAGLGDDVTPHTLRHTFATWAVQSGESFDDVAEAMGTTSAVVRRVYGHLAPQHTRRTVEAVSGRETGSTRGRRRILPLSD